MKKKNIALKTLILLMVLMMLFTGCSGTEQSADPANTPEHAETAETEELKPPLVCNSSMLDTGSILRDPEYKLTFSGDWDLITDEDYKIELENLFYEYYPQIYERWGTGIEPKEIEFRADPDEEGVAYCSGDLIVVSVDYANENPLDIGYFAHELTHVVQAYSQDIDWWCEGMASYGRFRYFQWEHKDTVSVIDQHSPGIAEWDYDPYGNGMLFFAYLDEKYPTKQNGDGTTEYGLIDSINLAIKDGIIDTDSHPEDPETSFNQVVKGVTGIDTIDEIRLLYVEACMNDTWTFTGFEGYPQLTADTEFDHKNIAKKSDAILEFEDNVFDGAKVIRSSGFINDDERDDYLIDGDLKTKWCAEEGDIIDMAYALDGVKHFMVIDLGEQKDFDSYTLYNGGSLEDSSYNARKWDILVSDDGVNFTEVDHQEGITDDVASFIIGETSARYVMLKIIIPDGGDGTVRLYELAAGSRS